MLLVLANVFYFMWDRFVAQEIPAGVAVVDESQLGPPLAIAKAATAEAATSAGAVLGSGQSSDLAEVVGRSCVSISFRERPEAASAMGDYRNKGMRASMRSAPGEVLIGNWVWIVDIPDREAGNAMLETLQSGGISEVLLLQNNGSYKISLGLFGEKSGVERMELQARSLGMDPQIVPEFNDAILHYVDLALLPGQGAGAMMERYGEERVSLRKKATCPTSD